MPSHSGVEGNRYNNEKINPNTETGKEQEVKK